MPDPAPALPPDPTRTGAAPPDPTPDPDSTQPGWAAGRSQADPLPAPAGRYALLAVIARGGMGVVYRAADPVLGREVAVKVLAGRYAPGSDAARRFLDEARITARLQHPAIPPVHDLGELADGRPFLALKLIDGETLDTILAGGGLSGARAGGPRSAKEAAGSPHPVAVFEAICQAVASAHSRGVIHRDLKPANVMVGAFGEVQVMDWGLAKVLAGHEDPPPGPPVPDTRPTLPLVHALAYDPPGSETVAGSVLGTPAYMPPEQAAGDLDRVDRRADVFGLGAILAVILTGEPPYVGPDAATVRDMAAGGQLGGCLDRLGRCGADPELVALCLRCLSPDPAGRPPDAGAVAAAVARLRTDAEDRARRAERDRAAAEVRAKEQRKRRRVQLALAAAVGLLAAGAGAAAWWQDRQATARRFEQDARDRDEADRLDRDRAEAAALLDRAEDALRAGDPDRAAVPLDQAGKRLAAGGAGDLGGRADRLRADLALVRELDRIDLWRWTPVDQKTPTEADLGPAWAKAFAAFGIEPGHPEAAATDDPPAGSPLGPLAGSAVRDRALAALERWLTASRSRGVAMILTAADPDPFRGEVRRAVLAGDGRRVAALAGQDVAGNQPAWFAAVLGENQAIPTDRRKGLLEGAAAARPNELALLMALDKLYPINRRAGADERARWCQAAAAAHPRNLTPWYQLGLALYDRGDPDGAARCYRQALALDPAHSTAHTALGLALLDRDDFTGAVAELREGVRLNPARAWAWFNLGVGLRDSGDLPGAEAAMRESVRLDPNRVDSRMGLGMVRWMQGDRAGAAGQFREAVRVDPTNPGPRDNLGSALTALGDAREAAEHFRESVRLAPKSPGGHNNLAWLLATGPDGFRDGRAAVEAATKACELDGWKTPNFVATLAAAHAEAGDFAKAVEYQEKALALPKNDTPRGRDRLKLYQAGKPYRQPVVGVAPPPRERGK